MSDGKIEDIICSYVTNYPLLKFWGKEIKKPIGLVFDSDAAVTDALRLMKNYCILFEPDSVPSKVKKILPRANSHGVVFVVNEKTKDKKALEILLNANLCGCCGEKPVSTALVFLFTRVVPSDLKGKVYEIHLSTTLKSFSLEDVVPAPTKLELVKDTIAKTEINVQDSLIPATAFLCGTCLKERYEEYVEVARELDSNAEAFSQQDGIAELFCDKIYEIIGDGEVGKVFRLPNVDEDGLANIEDVLFFNDKFVYMKIKYFEKLCKKIFGNAVSIIAVKAALLENEIIIADGEGYTTKMSYIRPSGKFERERMVRLDSKKMQGETRENLINYLAEVL